jgi:glyoxylase-like metal-dependent hydrolase (beta-lactamase superfamily II)
MTPNDGDFLELGNIKFQFFETPARSFAGVSYLLVDNNKAEAVFTGDALLNGDVGRPCALMDF